MLLSSAQRTWFPYLGLECREQGFQAAQAWLVEAASVNTFKYMDRFLLAHVEHAGSCAGV